MKHPHPIVYFFSDFGPHGPYTGQVEAVIREQTHARFIDLVNNAPPADPFHSAYLLAALVDTLPVKKGYLLAVVDPGVGSERQVIWFRFGKLVLMGPDNGLFSRLLARHGIEQVRVLERPSVRMSHSFHARDWFAPQLVRMIKGEDVGQRELSTEQLVGFDWPTALPSIIYIDHYGNLVTGLPASSVDEDQSMRIAGRQVSHAQTFSQVPPGDLFWYANSMGLVEIAANRERASDLLQAAISDPLTLD